MDRVIQAIFEEYGGKDAFFRESDKNLADLNALWSQDIALVGRVLRAHLVVEHFLTEYIQARNPQLPTLREAGLTFDQKVNLISENDRHISSLTPGIRRLNVTTHPYQHKSAQIAPYG